MKQTGPIGGPGKEAGMRKLALTGLLTALVIALAAPAFAHGPSGSREHKGRTYTNKVKCRKGTSTPVVGVVYAGTNGAEVCNDGRAVIPLRGRIIVTTQQGGYVAVDGDKRNDPAQAQGWIRIDGKGVRCGDDKGRLDSTHPSGKDTQADCG